MKTILVVDDERPFLLSLKDGLLSFSDSYNVILANDGRQALQLLEDQSVDLLVTDLQMPIMDGFQLLARVSRTYPQLPVIVMTAFGTPEIEKRLAQVNALHLLEKPLDFDLLAETIELALGQEKHSYIRGITLATFLQLVHMEQKSCTLKVRSQDRLGYLFINQGELIDAQTSTNTGEPAAMEIVAWDDAEIEMDSICRRTDKQIHATVEFILMEAFRIKDEAAHEQELAGVTQNAEAPGQPPTAPMPTDDQLLKQLQNNRSIREYAIFDNANFLEHQSEEPCALAKLDPAYFLAVSKELGQLLEAGPLRYMLFTTSRKERHLILQSEQRRVVVTLKEGGKPAEVINQLTPSLF